MKENAKKIIMRSIKLLYIAYHTVFPSNLVACRYVPTCSQYMLDATDKYGSFKGMKVTLKRILSCHPFSKRPLCDPV